MVDISTLYIQCIYDIFKVFNNYASFTIFYNHYTILSNYLCYYTSLNSKRIM